MRLRRFMAIYRRATLDRQAEGNIALYWFEHGWCWFIPLMDGTRASARCVSRATSSRVNRSYRIFLATIALCPPLAKRLAAAELVSPVTGTGNYSYRSKRMMGKDYIILGDAYAFIDPMFSTGVYVAMSSAFFGAEVVRACHARAG